MVEWNGTWSGIYSGMRKKVDTRVSCTCTSTVLFYKVLGRKTHSLIEEIVTAQCVEADNLDYVCSVVE